MLSSLSICSSLGAISEKFLRIRWQSILQGRCDGHECACSSFHQIEEYTGKDAGGQKGRHYSFCESKEVKNKWEVENLNDGVIKIELT